MTHKRITWIGLALLVLVLSACNGKDEEEANMIITQALQTAEAQLTQAALAIPTQTETLVPSPTPEPTETLIPTATSTTAPDTSYSAAAAVSSCDVAGFVDDVTIPDGTVFEPGEEFTKTWELRNDGSCTWTTDYQIVFYSGSSMDSDTPVDITSGSVAPGDSIDISVDMVAPDDDGSYTGYYILQNASGANFGLGTAGNPFYVQIVVSESDATSTVTSTATSTSVSAATSTTVPTATIEPTIDTGDGEVGTR